MTRINPKENSVFREYEIKRDLHCHTSWVCL